MVFNKLKFKLNQIYLLFNMFDMSNEYFTKSECELFKITEIYGDIHKIYNIYVYKSYEKIDDDEPLIMFNYESSIAHRDLKHVDPIDKIDKHFIIRFLFEEEIHL